MKQTLAILDRAFADHPRAVLAFSGGADSMVLLDIVYTRTDDRPALLFADTGMEYDETPAFIGQIAEHYGAELHVARPDREPLEQWERDGWPMLGKLAAVKWNRTHRNRGFRLNVSSCCQAMKLQPARRLAKEIGATCILTGQRGQADDALRGLRAIKDGSLYRHKASGLWGCNPLTGWTDFMIRRYTDAHDLPRHPARDRGAITIGCMYCGGGAQYTNSGFRVLRHTAPAAWRRFMVDMKAGEIVLAVKHGLHLDRARQIVQELGGLAKLADTRPWVFDFLRATPLQGYSK